MATLSSIITPTNITTATNTQTLTNKTLTGAVMNGTLGATTPSTVAATTLAVSSTSSFSTSAPSVIGSLGFRNRITNGAMRFDQRNAGASKTASTFANVLAVDKWKTNMPTSCAGTVIQQVTDAPTGFNYSHKITIGTGASPATGDLNIIYQSIEACDISDFNSGTANAVSVAVSFWVKSSIAGTYSFAINNGPTPNRSYPAQFTINSANTWEQKSASLTLDTSGTWLTSTGSVGMYAGFDIGSGTTYEGTASAWQAGNIKRISTNVKLVATTGATFQFTGVQLEIGSAATSYEKISYQAELARCQRYYSTSIETGATITNFTTLNSSGVGGVMAIANATNNDLFPNVRYPVPMATNPTLTVYSGANRTAGSVRNMINGTDIAGFSNGSATSNNMGFGYITGNTLFAGTVYGFHYTADTGL